MRVTQVRNVTRCVYVARHAEVADSFVRRGIGLLGRSDWLKADGLVIEPCRSIHTLFMRMPIDVVHVTADGIVCRVLPRLRPWRLGPLVWHSHYVVELPDGTIERTGTIPGDLLTLEPLGSGSLEG